MTSHVHAFDPREGGAFRISLTYDAPTGEGKTTAHTDTHHGRFVRLVPNEQVVQVVEFETADPALQGEMAITFTLADAQGGAGGTELLAVHEGLPGGVSRADNDLGWQMSMGKLAVLVEAGWSGPRPVLSWLGRVCKERPSRYHLRTLHARRPPAPRPAGAGGGGASGSGEGGAP